MAHFVRTTKHYEHHNMSLKYLPVGLFQAIRCIEEEDMMYKVSCSKTNSNIVMAAGFCREGHSDRFVVLSANGDEQESSSSFTLWALPLLSIHCIEERGQDGM